MALDFLPLQPQQPQQPQQGGGGAPPPILTTLTPPAAGEPQAAQIKGAMPFGAAGKQLQPFVFRIYENLLELHRDIKPEKWRNPNGDAFIDYQKRNDRQSLIERINEFPDWFGPGTDVDQLIKGYTEFQAPDLLEQARNEIILELPPELRNMIPRKKLRFNDRFGTMSMPRVFSAIKKVYAYTDAEGNDVEAKYAVQADNGEFRHSDTGDVLTQKVATLPDSDLPRVYTENKSVFAYMKPEPSMVRSLDIYVIIGYNASVTADAALMSAIPAVILTELFLKAGYKVRIHALFGGITSGKQSNDFNYIVLSKIKDWQHTINANNIALLTADPRFVRHTIFNAARRTMDESGVNFMSSLGMPVSTLGTPVIKSVMQQYYWPYVNPGDKARHVLYIDSGKIFANASNMHQLKENAKSVIFEAVQDIEKQFNYGNDGR